MPIRINDEERLRYLDEYIALHAQWVELNDKPLRACICGWGEERDKLNEETDKISARMRQIFQILRRTRQKPDDEKTDDDDDFDVEVEDENEEEKEDEETQDEPSAVPVPRHRYPARPH